MTVPVKGPTKATLLESVYIQGDLSKLNPEQKIAHYLEVCESLGLNPRTRPFQYIVLNGKEQLYAVRACTDQLRKIHAVSLEIVSRDTADGILTVHVRATMPDGRKDEDLGTVPLTYPDRFRDRNGNWINHPKAGKRLEGDDLANAELKAITKAKRRATLSICGLSLLDETEVETIPGAHRPTPAPNVMGKQPEISERVLAAGARERAAAMLPPHNPDTGEIVQPVEDTATADPSPQTTVAAAASADASSRSTAEAAPPDPSQEIKTWDDKLADAAKAGVDALKDAWDEVPKQHKGVLRAALERRHKATANLVDQERREAVREDQ